jgi:hypothetical protein
MTFWVLPSSCRVFARSTEVHLSQQDGLDDPLVKSRLMELDLAVADKIGNSIEDIDDALIRLFPQIPDDIFLPDAESGGHIPVDEADTLPLGASRERVAASVGDWVGCGGGSGAIDSSERLSNLRRRRLASGPCQARGQLPSWSRCCECYNLRLSPKMIL